MLQRVFKLTPAQYELLYNGQVVTSSDGNTTLQLNTTDYSLTINGASPALSRTEYAVEISDKYLTPDAVDDMFDDIDTVASTQDVANLFGTVSPETRQFIVDLVYPVGSIYMSINSTSPSTLFGGTWEQLENRFLLGAGSSYSAGDTGGSATHSHGLSSGYAYLNYTAGALYQRYNTGINWNAMYKITGGTGTASSDTNTDGTLLGGTTDNDSTLPPYLVVYMWKRIA